MKYPRKDILNNSKSYPLTRSFGRTRGRPLGRELSNIWQEWQDRVVIKPPKAEPNTLNPLSLFDFISPASTKNIIFDIGTGTGENFIKMALANPSSALLGCDPYLPGSAKTLQQIVKNNLHNRAKIMPFDVRLALSSFLSGSFDHVSIMFPDPWPKKRHKKRRLLSVDFLQEISRILKNNGRLEIASDHSLLLSEIFSNLLSVKSLKWQNNRRAMWQTNPHTRYGQKAYQLGILPVTIILNKI